MRCLHEENKGVITRLKNVEDDREKYFKNYDLNLILMDTGKVKIDY